MESQSTLLTWLPLFRRSERNALRYTSFSDKVYSEDSTKRSYPRSPACMKMRQVHRDMSGREIHPIEIDETEKLRQENERLKQRLNAANNAIRDLENVCKKSNKKKSVNDHSKTPFCAFVPRNLKATSRPNNTDDQSLFSSASTVRMGSLASKKQFKRGSRRSRKKSNEKVLFENKEAKGRILKKSSCVQSFIFSQQRRHEENDSRDVQTIGTAPCTPERLSRTEQSNQNTFSYSGNDLKPTRCDKLQDTRFNLKGIVLNDITASSSFNTQTSSEVQEKPQKKNFLFQAVMKSAPLTRMAADSLPRPHNDSEDKHFLVEKENITGRFPRVQNVYQSSITVNSDDSIASDSLTSGGAGIEVLHDSFVRSLPKKQMLEI